MLSTLRSLRHAGWTLGFDSARHLRHASAFVAGAIRSAARSFPKTLSQVSSVWFAIALIVLMFLEIPSEPGRTLEKLHAEIVAGWLGQLVLLSLLIDSARGVVPRGTAIIPAAFYLCYYFAFWEQGVQIHLRSAALRGMNPGRVIEFDPRLHSLVTPQADVFAATHLIPVAYSRELSYIQEGYMSYRLIEKGTIKDYLKLNAAGAQLFSIESNNVFHRNVDELRFPERPPHKIIAVNVHDDGGEGWKDWNIGFTATSLNVDGKVIALYKSGYVDRLQLIPFFTIGCAFDSMSPERNCHAEFGTERTPIESRPDFVDRTLFTDPVSIMTGIRGISDYALANFHDYDVDPPIRPAVGEDAAFSALQEIISGRSPPLSWTTSFLLANNPSRLAPFAAAMTKRFIDLNEPNAVDVPGRLEQIRLLAIGIAALNSPEFSTAESSLSDFGRTRNDLRNVFPLLYIRLADADPKLFSIYRDQFLAQDATQRDKLLAVIAICRIGQADSELISAITAEWTKFDTGALKDSNYQAALFVALLKLGQESTVKPLVRQSSKSLRGWYEAVLSGRGKTDAGPNNCMPMEWPEDTFVPRSLAPRLKWSNERWDPAD